MLTTEMMPPKIRNWDTWSTSLVTRETRAPRRSVFWVSSGRSCTCRNALIRSVLRVARLLVGVDEVGVPGVAGQQLGVGPLVLDAAGAEVDHLVGQRDRRLAVGHHQHGGVLPAAAQRGEDAGLHLRVDRRG